MIVGVGLAVLWAARRGAADSALPAAAPPRRRVTRADELLASLINAQNAEMRSVELGRWFVASLRRVAASFPGAMNCDSFVDAVPYDAIASRVPRINDIARRETARLLRELLSHAAADCGPGGVVNPRDVDAKLAEFGEAAFDDLSGLLWGVNGYTARSRVPLPRA